MKDFWIAGLQVLIGFLIGGVVIGFVIAPAIILLAHHILLPYWDWVAKL